MSNENVIERSDEPFDFEIDDQESDITRNQGYTPICKHLKSIKVV